MSGEAESTTAPESSPPAAATPPPESASPGGAASPPDASTNGSALSGRGKEASAGPPASGVEGAVASVAALASRTAGDASPASRTSPSIEGVRLGEDEQATATTARSRAPNTLPVMAVRLVMMAPRRSSVPEQPRPASPAVPSGVDLSRALRKHGALMPRFPDTIPTHENGRARGRALSPSSSAAPWKSGRPPTRAPTPRSIVGPGATDAKNYQCGSRWCTAREHDDWVVVDARERADAEAARAAAGGPSARSVSRSSRRSRRCAAAVQRRAGERSCRARRPRRCGGGVPQDELPRGRGRGSYEGLRERHSVPRRWRLRVVHDRARVRRAASLLPLHERCGGARGPWL